MGNRFGKDLDEPSQVPGLTLRQVKLVQDSWNLVKTDLVGTFAEILYKFFDKYPDDQQRFSFRDVQLLDLRQNVTFKAHAQNVGYKLTEVVNSLNDMDLLTEVLKQVGIKHGRRNIPRESFEGLKEVIITVLKDRLRDKVSIQCLEAWSKLLNLANKVIFAELQ